MARYIDANALIQDIEQSKANNDHNNSIASQTHNAEHKKFIKMVLDQPTADVVEVKRGEWEKIKKLFVAVNPYKHTCGLCGKSYFDHNKFNYPYCPNCGADMRGDEK